MNIQGAIARVVSRRDLTQEEARQVTDQIMSGQATDAQIAAYLVAMRMKGESVDEIAGSVQAMRQKAVAVHAPGRVVDTCGTGGDALGTFNISTTVSFVVAACGVTVAKHGNRSISSKSGSADLLKALGVQIEADVPVVEKCLREVGIGFLFAPRHHGAMRHALRPRQEIAIRTLFNLLGPLTNPAGAPYQLIGVFDGAHVELLAHVLGLLGSQRAMVVHGLDGLDEITLTGPTQVAELSSDRNVKSYTITPEQFGLSPSSLEHLRGGDAETNAAITRAILDGEPGPKRDIVVLNAAAALYVAESVKNIEEGILAARHALDAGLAKKKLALLAQISNG
ncbi:MAG: anthranilate phosphoribosyltransferase [Magnetococcales bacterium]|nr:anthranilate phosphoribosyltransferase [Magnetococcales bacterium]MBF0322109.1 anthranilate phosphoribosyltransferase [Magnetococcales bacterium]